MYDIIYYTYKNTLKKQILIRSNCSSIHERKSL